MANSLSRRKVLQLTAVIAAGWGLSNYLKGTVPVGRDVSDNPAATGLLQDKRSPTLEVKEPTLTLVVFSDYLCPACKLASPAMEAAVAADDHVRVIYKDWPIFGPLAERAARVAIASARQGIYPAVHRSLMDERRRLDDPVLREAVEKSGGDWQQIVSVLNDQATDIDREIALNVTEAVSLGLQGTPAFLAGSVLISGATDEGGFRRAFARGRTSAQD